MSRYPWDFRLGDFWILTFSILRFFLLDLSLGTSISRGRESSEIESPGRRIHRLRIVVLGTQFRENHRDIVLGFTRWFLHCFHLSGKSSNYDAQYKYLLLPWVEHLVTCRYFRSRHISRISLVFQPWFSLPARYHISNSFVYLLCWVLVLITFPPQDAKSETIS